MYVARFQISVFEKYQAEASCTIAQASSSASRNLPQRHAGFIIPYLTSGRLETPRLSSSPPRRALITKLLDIHASLSSTLRYVSSSVWIAVQRISNSFATVVEIFMCLVVGAPYFLVFLFLFHE